MMLNEYEVCSSNQYGLGGRSLGLKEKEHTGVFQGKSQLLSK